MSPTKSNQTTQTPEMSQEDAKENDQNSVSQPSQDYSIRPDFSKVKDFTKTLELQRGVSVKYGEGWTGKKTGDDKFVSGQLIKTVGGRSYEISMSEINHPTADISGTKIYATFNIDKKPHSIDIMSNSSTDGTHYYASVISCSELTQKDCSLTLEKNYLNIVLLQYVPNAQEAVSLDFSRPDDQQILAEFAEIMSTLKY